MFLLEIFGTRQHKKSIKAVIAAIIDITTIHPIVVLGMDGLVVDVGGAVDVVSSGIVETGLVSNDVECVFVVKLVGVVSNVTRVISVSGEVRVIGGIGVVRIELVSDDGEFVKVLGVVETVYVSDDKEDVEFIEVVELVSDDVKYKVVLEVVKVLSAFDSVMSSDVTSVVREVSVTDDVTVTDGVGVVKVPLVSGLDSADVNFVKELGVVELAFVSDVVKLIGVLGFKNGHSSKSSVTSVAELSKLLTTLALIFSDKVKSVLI